MHKTGSSRLPTRFSFLCIALLPPDLHDRYCLLCMFLHSAAGCGVCEHGFWNSARPLCFSPSCLDALLFICGKPCWACWICTWDLLSAPLDWNVMWNGMWCWPVFLQCQNTFEKLCHRAQWRSPFLHFCYSCWCIDICWQWESSWTVVGLSWFESGPMVHSAAISFRAALLMRVSMAVAVAILVTDE